MKTSRSMRPNIDEIDLSGAIAKKKVGRPRKSLGRPGDPPPATPPPVTSSMDAEIAAIVQCCNAIESLDDPGRRRVWKYLADRYEPKDESPKFPIDNG